MCYKENNTYSFYLGIDRNANPGHWTVKVFVDDTEEISSVSSFVVITGFNLFLSAIIAVFEPCVNEKKYLMNQDFICSDRKKIMAEKVRMDSS